MFQVMTVLPFSTKNAFLTANLLESSLAQFRNVMCCFQGSGIKISNVMTKETSQILLQTLALTETANKFSQSLRGLIHQCRT